MSSRPERISYRFHTSPYIMLHARTKTKQHLLGIQQHTVLTGIILFPRTFLGVSNLMLPKTNQYESIATFIAQMYYTGLNHFFHAFTAFQVHLSVLRYCIPTASFCASLILHFKCIFTYVLTSFQFNNMVLLTQMYIHKRVHTQVEDIYI